MQVRVRQSDKSEQVWLIEYRHWWWPFWQIHGSWYEHKTAEMFALRLKHPVITNIK